DDVHTDHAGNRPYRHVNRWMITVIDRKADSDIPAKIAAMPTASFSRRFTADGLNHTIYNLHF
ncbi:hypothetical protein NL444_26995, partial [Klebsiella pneumoniae]|nr:hypothetical protein [Klebsiella pneumoniae]